VCIASKAFGARAPSTCLGAKHGRNPGLSSVAPSASGRRPCTLSETKFWCVASPCQANHLVPQIFEYLDREFELRRSSERGGKRTLEPGGKLRRPLAEAIACFYGSLVAKMVLGIESKKSLQQKESDTSQTTGAVKNVSLGGELMRMEQGEFHRP
jgi:hypothetical protein